MAALYATGRFTFDEIGDIFGLSRQRVHQILTRANAAPDEDTKEPPA
jgi:hypothetical protein